MSKPFWNFCLHSDWLFPSVISDVALNLILNRELNPPRASLCVSAACPVSYFKSVSGSVPCSVCPSNSRTSQEGSTACECRSGFYRAAKDANSSACTSELCWFVCLRLALWEVLKGPHRSFVIHSDCGNRDESIFWYHRLKRIFVIPLRG